MQKHGWWCACLLSILWIVVGKLLMTCAGSCIYSHYQLSCRMHQLVLLRVSKESLPFFSLHPCLLPNNSNRPRTNQTDSNKGFSGSITRVSSMLLVCIG